MSQLQQALFAHRCITAGGRRVQAHTPSTQVVHPHQLACQFLLERLPAPIVAQISQDICQAIITQIAHLQHGIAPASQRFQAMFCPQLHAIHAVLGLREDVGQPQSRHPAQTQPHTVAVRRKVPIQQLNQSHALHLSQQQRDVIDPLGLDCQCFIHITKLIRIWRLRPDLREP